MSPSPLVANSEPSQDGISAAYVGPALAGGRIDVLTIADSLRGLARLVARVDYLLNGDRYTFRIELDEGVRRGSVVVPLEFYSHALRASRAFLESKAAQELATLMGILGWGLIPGANSLLKLFKQRNGRPIDDNSVSDPRLRFDDRVPPTLIIRIYNDREVQSLIRAVLRALRKEGIDEFQTRRNNVAIEIVTKRDLAAADTIEEQAVEEEQEKTLDIEKIALLPHLAWHFSDKGRPFDAQIQDPDLWDRVSKGERFGYGDKMRVLLRTRTEREPSGKLTYTRTIPTVYDVEHAEQSQLPLFPE